LLRQPRPRERPAGDDQRRRERNPERCRALDPRSPDQEPEHHRRDTHCDAAARERQKQRDERRVQIQDSHRAQPVRPRPRRRDPQCKRHREHAQQREDVPVPDRAVQPRDALGLDRQRREDLRRERHADRDRRHRRKPPRRKPRYTPQRSDRKP
jgi:hypothetical protein